MHQNQEEQSPNEKEDRSVVSTSDEKIVEGGNGQGNRDVRRVPAGSAQLLRGLGGCSVDIDEGRVEFSDREADVYLRLFRILDLQGCSSISGKQTFH